MTLFPLPQVAKLSDLNLLMQDEEMQKLSRDGLDLIKRFEGLRLEVYLDIAGLRTCGYGSRCDELPLGQKITMQEAEDRLRKDVATWEARVNARFPNLGEQQFSALVSLCFNVGSGPLRGTIGRHLTAKNMPAAAEAFLAWNKVAGAPVRGLTARRVAERELFLKDTVVLVASNE